MSEHKARELSVLRSEIDSIDRQLIDLFLKRMDVSKEVGDYKRERGMAVYDGRREQQVIAARTALAEKAEFRPYVEQLIRGIMEYSKEVQRAGQDQPAHPAKCVAFQGKTGAYGEEAARTFFGDTPRRAMAQFEDVFMAVAGGEVEYGVVPVENSLTGSVTANYDLLGKYGLHVCGEVILPIRHVLMGVSGASLADIKAVYSHEQGILQCSSFLNTHPDWQRVLYHNTATSAAHVAECGDKAKAAIASEYVAEVYGLSVLKREIADTLANHTRFFALCRTVPKVEGADKATVMFIVNHESGSLVRVLELFAQKGYNLTKIESRPIEGKNWEYRFYVDLEGDMEKLPLDMENIEAYCVQLRLCGQYRKASK
ncbi:MAG: prephenate dehydratase [Christensenellaceae bacterium]|nr:prephenate dehydratase [Christensenellaceae bacterium]